MHFSRIFIERPIMTTLVVFAIVLFGVVGYRALPVAALPSVDYPTIQVAAGLPGADPETMASSVATPLEREFSTIAGVKQMSSTNAQGLTTITVQFDLSRKIDDAAQDIVLVRDVVVERHCLETEHLAELAHGQGIDPALVGELERGPEDPVAAEGEARLGLRGH